MNASEAAPMNAKRSALFSWPILAVACSASSSNPEVAGEGGSASCNTLANHAPVISLPSTTAAAPHAQGGTILDGTYVLSSNVLYGSVPESDAEAANDAQFIEESETLSISGSTWQMVGSAEGTA